MGFQLVAYSSVPNSANLTQINAVTDQIMSIQGNAYLVPQGLNMIIGAYIAAVHVTRAQLQSPTLRRIVNQELVPVDQSATPQVPPRVVDMFTDPRTLTVGEQLSAWAIDATAAEVCNILVFLADGIQSPVSGEIVTVRATGTTTLVANAWTLVSLTFDQLLPAGTYQLVGMRARSTGLVAARVVPLQGAPRPGCIANIAASDIPYPMFQDGRLGVWCSFTNLTIPQIECFSTSADTAETFELDLIQVSSSF